MNPASVALTSVAAADRATLRDLAGSIWRRHYAEIIPPGQIEHMLAARFDDEALLEHLREADRWLELLRVSGVPAGYVAYELGHGDGVAGPDAMKLGQLYVAEAHRGAGLGRFMLGHVEDRARCLGRQRLVLQVNKRNTGAIGFYEAAGFTITRAAVFDIGSGFVMDDYVMETSI